MYDKPHYLENLLWLLDIASLHSICAAYHLDQDGDQETLIGRIFRDAKETSARSYLEPLSFEVLQQVCTQLQRDISKYPSKSELLTYMVRALPHLDWAWLAPLPEMPAEHDQAFDWEAVHTLGGRTAASVRDDDQALLDIAMYTDLTLGTVRRQIDASHGNTRVQKVFADRWPEPDEGSDDDDALFEHSGDQDGGVLHTSDFDSISPDDADDLDDSDHDDGPQDQWEREEEFAAQQADAPGISETQEIEDALSFLLEEPPVLPPQHEAEVEAWSVGQLMHQFYGWLDQQEKLHVYPRHGDGAILTKHKFRGKERYTIFYHSDAGQPIRPQQLQRFRKRYRNFRGRDIDYFTFLAAHYTDDALAALENNQSAAKRIAIYQVEEDTGKRIHRKMRHIYSWKLLERFLKHTYGDQADMGALLVAQAAPETPEVAFPIKESPTPTFNAAAPHQTPQLKSTEVLAKRYRIDRHLGSGGMGQVFLSLDLLTKRFCALKLINPDVVNTEQLQQRFQRELTVTQKLSHPNIVRSYDLQHDHERGFSFYTMEYLEGETLAQRIRARRKQGQNPLFTIEEILHILEQLTQALSYIHSQGIVHRDLKPANLMFVDGDRLKVMDFGIASEFLETENAHYTSAVGSKYYIAPEQEQAAHRNVPVSPAADIYALGVITYQLFTGRLPQGVFQPPSSFQPSLPPMVDEVIHQALQQSPEERTQSAQAFFRPLQKVLGNSEQQALQGLSPRPAPPPMPHFPTGLGDDFSGTSSHPAAAIHAATVVNEAPSFTPPPDVDVGLPAHQVYTPAPGEAPLPISPSATSPTMHIAKSGAVSEPALETPASPSSDLVLQNIPEHPQPRSGRSGFARWGTLGMLTLLVLGAIFWFVRGRCPTGQQRCGSRCVAIQKNVQHCGACGKACRRNQGQICLQGQCQCPAKQRSCGGQCKNLNQDNAHCGACGKACAQGLRCRQGQCQCPQGQALCQGQCVDLQRDNRHCGQCGHFCVAGCAQGRCKKPMMLTIKSLPNAVALRATAGSFTLGTSDKTDKRAQRDEKPASQARLSHDFWIWRSEVTQAQYQSLTGEKPARFKACGPTCPVESITWHQALAFANALSNRQQLTPCFICKGKGRRIRCRWAPKHLAKAQKQTPHIACKGWRLPTEAEWDYAAKGAQKQKDGGNAGRGLVAWTRENSRRTQPSMQTRPNPLGLFDMQGNVWEWTLDRYQGYTDKASTDRYIQATKSWHPRVLRGGSWRDKQSWARLTSRYKRSPTRPKNDIGFRIVRTIRSKPTK